MLRKLLVCALVWAIAAPQALASDYSLQLALWRQVSFPLDNFLAISSRFGWRKPVGASPRRSNGEFHSGLDLAAPMGSYIRAWADGRIEKVSYDNRCGWHIVTTSAEWTSTYCHISAVAVQEGQVVQAGQVVAAVGSTGRSTGPHLHWTLRYQSKLVDPELVLQAMQLAWQGQSAPPVLPSQDVPEPVQADRPAELPEL